MQVKRVKRVIVVVPWLNTPCSSNGGDCSQLQSNTECFDNTCVCRPGYFYSVSLGTCNTGKSHCFDRERESVCVCERERMCVRACVCVCEN